jgi:predicted RNase H-like HicB family nuclease
VTTQFDTASEARANFKALLDAAEAGVSVAILRERARTVVVDAERLRQTLCLLVIPDVQVFNEDGQWGAYLPQVPSVSATGDTFDELIDDLVDACREYAADWNDHLRLAPNHADAWGFVQVVTLSDDAQLRDWLTT